jgi:hypothetical protein
MAYDPPLNYIPGGASYPPGSVGQRVASLDTLPTVERLFLEVMAANICDRVRCDFAYTRRDGPNRVMLVYHSDGSVEDRYEIYLSDPESTLQIYRHITRLRESRGI